MPDDTSALLAERGKTHGRFEDHARCSMRLMRTIDDEIYHRAGRGQRMLTDQQVEALRMIAHKIGRILAGDANFADHWDDIAGYARLGRDGHSRSEPKAFANARENFPGPCPDLDQECCGGGDCQGCPETAPKSRLAGVTWSDPFA